MTTLHNVHDRRYGWIGSWEAEPLDVSRLTPADRGRTVIYVDQHGQNEAGTLSSWNAERVWARYSRGDTAAAADPADLWLAVKPLDGDMSRVAPPKDPDQ